MIIEMGKNKEFDFYNIKLLDSSNNQKVLKELFIMRVYWKIMKDLDIGDGYKVEGWKIEDYNKFIDRLDEVDLNKNEYRLYFKEMFDYIIKNEEVGINSSMN